MNPPDSLRFLSALFAPYQSKGATVDIRCLQSGRGGAKGDLFVPLSELERAATHATEQAKRGLDVYCGVLPRKAGRGKADGVRQCAFLWVDVDGGQEDKNDPSRPWGPRGALDLLTAALAKHSYLPRPSVVVASGGGVHAYFSLEKIEPCQNRDDQDRVRKVLRRLANLIGGKAPGPHADTSCADVARILRVAGTFNYKKETPRPVRLIRCGENAQARSLDWWIYSLPEEELPPPFRPTNRPQPHRQGRDGFPAPQSWRDLAPETRRKVEQGAPEGSRYPTMKDVATACRKAGLDYAATLEAVETCVNNSGINAREYTHAIKINKLVEWEFTDVQPDHSTGGGTYR